MYAYKCNYKLFKLNICTTSQHVKTVGFWYALNFTNSNTRYGVQSQ